MHRVVFGWRFETYDETLTSEGMFLSRTPLSKLPRSSQTYLVAKSHLQK